MRDGKWLEKYNLAKEYYLEHGDLLINKTYKVGEVKLGQWINQQRRSNRLGKLSFKRKELLDKIGMVWFPREKGVINKNWLLMYKEAVLYYKEHGNLEVPFKYTYNSQGKIVKLGSWLSTQRSHFNMGKLTNEQIKLLNDICMNWENHFDTKWNYMFDLAKDYYLKNNKLFSSNYKLNIDGNDILLGSWLNNQKRFYNEGKLTEERIKLLETIGLKWTKEERKQTRENKENKKWIFLYKRVLEYYKEHGDLVLPKDYKVIFNNEEVLLKKWYINQKQKLKNLPPEKEELINGLIKLSENNKIKTSSDKKWMDFYNLAKEYYSYFGNLEINSTYEVMVNEKVKKLGIWLNHQRRHYKQGKLNEERVKLLNELEMVWSFEDIKKYNWIDNYNLAEKYYEEHGDLLIDKDYVIDDVYLRNWVYFQKVKYFNNKLSSEQIKLLEDIGIVWNSTKVLKK